MSPTRHDYHPHGRPQVLIAAIPAFCVDEKLVLTDSRTMGQLSHHNF